MSDDAQHLPVNADGNIDKLVAAYSQLLPPPEQWSGIAGYPDSLALAVIDAIWSIGTRYPITSGVIGRYRSFRRLEQADASTDSLSDLLGLYDRLGGIDAFIDEIGTRNRVSTQPDAPRKADAVHQAATLLKSLGIDTAEQFRAADDTDCGQHVQDAWRKLLGQKSGISWRYLRMLLGLPDIKPDRMVRRFAAAALGTEEGAITPDVAAALLKAAAHRMRVDPWALDHEIWEHQSGRRGTHDQQSTLDHLRTAAQTFIGAAIPALAEYHLVPTSFYRPFLRAGHDYEGTVVMGLPEFRRVSAELDREEASILYSGRSGMPRSGSYLYEYPPLVHVAGKTCFSSAGNRRPRRRHRSISHCCREASTASSASACAKLTHLPRALELAVAGMPPATLDQTIDRSYPALGSLPSATEGTGS